MGKVWIRVFAVGELMWNMYPCCGDNGVDNDVTDRASSRLRYATI